jgi:hypothetical protein
MVNQSLSRSDHSLNKNMFLPAALVDLTLLLGAITH